MFGVTTPAVQQIAAALRGDYECLVFHATGVGGRSMEKLVDSGLLAGVIDITTTEVGDLLMGGVFRRPRIVSAPSFAPASLTSARSARSTWSISDRPTPSRALPWPQAARSQSAGHANAHHAEENETHRPLDRRAPQRDGRAGAVLSA